MEVYNERERPTYVSTLPAGTLRPVGKKNQTSGQQALLQIVGQNSWSTRLPFSNEQSFSTFKIIKKHNASTQ